MPWESDFKMYDGTNWIDPCECPISIADGSNIFRTINPHACETRYWDGCEWKLLKCNCICPDRYVFNPDTGLCEIVEVIPAEPTPEATYQLIPGDRVVSYNGNAGKLYQDITGMQYPLHGYQFCPPGCASCGNWNTCSVNNYRIQDNAGVGTLLTIQNTSSNNVFTSGNTNIRGRLNLAGIWANTVVGGTLYPDGEWLSFSICINITEEKTYVFGIAGDNQVRARIDSTTFNGGGITNLITLFASQNPDGSSPGSGTTGSNSPFTSWHMFPITLPAGDHVLILEGMNLGIQASFAGEVYNTTEQEMIDMMNNSALTVAELESRIIFTTKTYRDSPTPFPVAAPDETIDWECPEGYELSLCHGIPSCVRIETVEC